MFHFCISNDVQYIYVILISRQSTDNVIKASHFVLVLNWVCDVMCA